MREMFYVNARNGSRVYRQFSTEPEAALLYYQDAMDKGFIKITIKDNQGKLYSPDDLRKFGRDLSE